MDRALQSNDNKLCKKVVPRRCRPVITTGGRIGIYMYSMTVKRLKEKINNASKN